MSNNNNYQVYLDKVMQLANTLIIKSDDSVTGLNKYVTDYFGSIAVDTLDPKSWKYYLNISGQYHFSDTMMQVISLDTLELINFTKENLAIHRATARGYVYGARQYIELVNQYPNQELLIMGIIYPVDINKAIAAKDGQILGYPSDLVEPNEYSLINNIQKWIYGYKIRWTNYQYAISDDLYSATSLGIMYLNLVPLILNLRLEACKTNEAHSFHVTQYLASHGLLESYLNQMTTKQALFFYRNISYIERNSGKRYIFEWLVEHIMTERFLPLAEYTMRHDISGQPNDNYPKIIFAKKQLNAGYSADLTDNLSLNQLMNKSDNQARKNIAYKDDYTPIIQSNMENSLYNVLITKMLESSVIDNTNSLPYTLEDVLMNHWVYLSTSNIYTAYINVSNPKTGEVILLNAKEAYALFWYALCKSVNILLDTIPKVFAIRVQRSPLPTINDLMSVVDSNLFDEFLADAVLSLHSDFTNIISTEAFYNKCNDIYNASRIERGLISLQEHYVKHGMATGLVARMYSDNVCSLSNDGDNYTAWFALRGIDIEALSRDDLVILYTEIAKYATGLNLTSTSSLANLQAAMINLLKQLSSYSIQIIPTINSSTLKQTDQNVIKVGNISEKIHNIARDPDVDAGVLDINATIKDQINFLIRPIHLSDLTGAKIQASATFEIPSLVHDSKSGQVQHMKVNILPIRGKPLVPLVSNPESIVPAIGIDDYLLLNPTQRQEFKDIYNGGYTPISPDLTTLALNLAGHFYVSDNYLVNETGYIYQ